MVNLRHARPEGCDSHAENNEIAFAFLRPYASPHSHMLRRGWRTARWLRSLWIVGAGDVAQARYIGADRRQ